jgi:Flp pilus assembly protein TadG
MVIITASTDGDRDLGSVSIWLATASLVMIILVGLAVDLGGQVHTQQRARDIAAQAARVGGEQVLAGSAIRGQGVQVDAGAAKSAARDYLAAAGVSGSATIQGGDTLVVTTTDTYQTTFLGIIGLNRLTVTGHASARIIRDVGGVAR